MAAQESIQVVVYGVKSSPDDKETVADQHRIVHEAIEREGGRTVAGTFGEANQSGYRKERGPQLEAAMRQAVDAAAEHGQAELWVWHSSRLARGDGTRGRRSIAKIVNDLRYEGVTVRSATDNEMVSVMLAGIASTVSNSYSESLSVWTAAGVKRRRQRGEPVGALPGIGYQIDAWLDEHGRRCSGRIVNPSTGPLVVAMFERIADGHTPGTVGRWLNDQSVRTVRGALFNQRTVRKVIANDSFVGANGYPRIVTDELAARARAAVVKLDPAEVQRRKGGRRPKEPYMLRGIVFCAGCGAALYRSHAYRGRQRTYVCRNKLEATGACTQPPIPAEVLETLVLNHLSTFVGSVEGWIRDVLSERKADAVKRQSTLDVKRAALAVLDRRREERLSEIVEQGITSPVAFEVIERIDRQRQEAQSAIEQSEAVVSEWEGTPDVDAVLDFYDALVDVIQGRIRQAPGVQALNEALASVLAGLWCELDGDRLLVQFAVRAPTVPDVTLPGGGLLHPALQPPERDYLPPASLSYEPVEPLETTEHLTTVSACLP